ncbi:hypothetical protein WA026_011515 [Henosepilachna vigintioctopunctata]|uniref:Uncharacterized protein n=1 Tax=Henosepilachna vigintioctopunctata TaxID=420089 RepID=A0AAW1TSA9_9CUCU
MGKVNRYFQPVEDNVQSSTNENKFVEYDVDFNKIHGRKKKFKNVHKERKIIKRIPNKNPKFKGRAPISKELLEKYGKGDGVDCKEIKTKIHQKKIEKKELDIKFATEQAARTEILLTEEYGCFEADDGETSTQFRQNI